MSTDVVMRYQRLEARLALVEGRECDRDDYLIATFCGAIAGLIDSFFVGIPNSSNCSDNSVLGKEIDKISEQFVEKFADISIARDNKIYDKLIASLSNENLPKREFNKRLKEELLAHGIPENFSREKGYTGFRGEGSKLVYLENKFRVSYDQSNKSKLYEDIDFVLTPDNHHLKSIAHWPDIIGLFAAIADQFSGQTTFISNGTMYRATPNHNLPVLRGKTVPQKLFFGFVNWFGHLLSDFCGSHSSKGRGDGISIPFFGLFLACDFGNFSYGKADTQNGLSLADLAVKVYEQGYDARFGITMSIPLLLQDMMTRFIWALKSRFVHKKPWEDCIPTEKHQDLRMMLLIGNSTLCVIDGTDALIRSKLNLMEFILHLNIIAWFKLSKRALKEICIRYDFTYADLKLQYEFLDHQLKLYILQLQAIDYGLYAEKIEEIDDISNYIECDDWEAAIKGMDAYIEKHGIQTVVKDQEDFESKLRTNGVNFKIGG